ncbi:MAG: TonB-dependent receptor [Prevotellaceae bacterium]|nr:TonB-dependent receptor [Candidatus Colivivens equi]
MRRLSIIFYIICCIVVMSVSVNAVAQKKVDKKEKRETTKEKKERKITLSGRVLNSFTKAGIEAKVTLMKDDSTFVDTTRCWYSYSGNDAKYWIDIPAKPAKYIIKAEHPEYYTSYINYEINHIARNTIFEAPWILMKRKNPTKDLDQMLDQVEIVASKVKFLHKGDTLVFNADAFNVPEGSMLDDLIKQLPGVELKKGGEIYVNGRKVDELLLNGDKFINGNTQLMLENLPYYVVKDIQVYDRMNERDRWEGKQTDKKEYVMDVKMKKEFLGGYMGNIDVGAGTSERWLGRFFTMRHSDHSQLAIFGNINNVNVGSRPGENAEWDPNSNNQSEQTTKNIGVWWYAHDKNKTFDENLDIDIQWRKNDMQMRLASEDFASAGNIFTRSQSANINDIFSINFNNNFRSEKLFGNKNLFLSSYLSFGYNKGESNSLSRNATLNSDPSEYGLDIPQLLDSIFSTIKGMELYDKTTNRSMNSSFNNTQSFSINGNIDFNWKLPWGDVVGIGVFGATDKQIKGDSFSRNKTEFLQNSSVDFRNEYQPSPTKNYNFGANFSYNINFLSGWRLSPSFNFSQNYSDNANEYYRLDRLGKSWGADSEYELGRLPSTRDSLLLALDLANSDWRDEMHRQYQSGINISKSFENDSSYTHLYLRLNAKINQEWMKLKYTRSDITDEIDDNNIDIINKKYERTNVSPSAGLGFQRSWHRNNNGGYIYADYNFNTTQPGFNSLYDLSKTTNPLVINYANPNLKNGVSHFINAYYNKWGKFSYGLGGNIQFSQNNIGMRTLYNPKTGFSAYKPGNINGNWNGGIEANISVQLDSAEHWNFDISPSFRYNHNVDFDRQDIDKDFITDEDFNDYDIPLSKVNTITSGGRINCEYNYDELRLSVNGNLDWNKSTSTRTNFQTINAFEFNYGFSGKYTIKKWALTASSSITMFSKRGYQDSEMNTDHLIWNMSLSKSFLKGKPLMLKVEGVDLLHQLSNTSMIVNAQGRTEVWYNSIPHYIMLHAVYKFNINPKK